MLFYILGFVLCSLIGAGLHFVFDLTNHSKCSAWLAAVNESVWEHLKIATWPMLIWGVIGLFVLNLNNWAFGLFVAILSIYAFIVLIFYTYTLFTNKSILIVDIIIFLVAIGIAIFVSYQFFTANQLPNIFNIIGIVGLSLITLCCAIFSYFPPRFILFKDPITEKYGIKGHSYCNHKHHNKEEHTTNIKSTSNKSKNFDTKRNNKRK